MPKPTTETMTLEACLSLLAERHEELRTPHDLHCHCKGHAWHVLPADSALAELLRVARQNVVEVVFCWLRPYWPPRPDVVSCYLYPIQQAPIIGYGDSEELALARALVSVEGKP